MRHILMRVHYELLYKRVWSRDVVRSVRCKKLAQESMSALSTQLFRTFVKYVKVRELSSKMLVEKRRM